MGHNGYLNINDKLFYCAKTESGIDDMTLVTAKISQILFEMYRLFDQTPGYGIHYGEEEIIARKNPFNDQKREIGAGQLYTIAQHTAQQVGLEQLTTEAYNQEKNQFGSDGPALALKIDEDNKMIYLSPYTAQYLPGTIKQYALPVLLCYNYSVISTEFNPLDATLPITKTRKPGYMPFISQEKVLEGGLPDDIAEAITKMSRRKAI